MGEAIVLGVLLLVVIIKAGTMHRLSDLQGKIQALQVEETDVTERLIGTEKAMRQLDQDHKHLTQELRHRENDKDLVCLEITKLGQTPIPESQLDQPVPTPPQNQTTRAARESKQPESETPEEAPQDQDTPADQPPPRPRSPNEKQRVLVVDDNTELRSLLQKALSKEFEVLEAVDGFDALTKVLKEKQHYDLIITDLKMPNIDGITLVEHLPEGVPTIVISGFLQNEDYQEALARLAPSSVLEKPFPMSSLRKAITKALAT